MLPENQLVYMRTGGGELIDIERHYIAVSPAYAVIGSTFGSGDRLEFNLKTIKTTAHPDGEADIIVGMSSSSGYFKGIEYNHDYSALYTDRSLPDKAYVDGRYTVLDKTAVTSWEIPLDENMGYSVTIRDTLFAFTNSAVTSTTKNKVEILLKNEGPTKVVLSYPTTWLWKFKSGIDILAGKYAALIVEHYGDDIVAEFRTLT